MLLKLSPTKELTGGLVKRQIVIRRVWGEQESAFLVSSQVRLRLLV